MAEYASPVRSENKMELFPNFKKRFWYFSRYWQVPFGKDSLVFSGALVNLMAL